MQRARAQSRSESRERRRGGAGWPAKALPQRKPSDGRSFWKSERYGYICLRSPCLFSRTTPSSALPPAPLARPVPPPSSPSSSLSFLLRPPAFPTAKHLSVLTTRTTFSYPHSPLPHQDMMMFSLPLAALAAALLAPTTVSAHGYVSSVGVGGKNYTGWLPFTDP